MRVFAREINSNNVVQSKNPQLTLTQNINYNPKLSNPDKSINFIGLPTVSMANRLHTVSTDYSLRISVETACQLFR